MNRKYNTPIGLTSQFSFCGLPLRLDSYSGCALSCTYCFARLRGGNANSNKLRYANAEAIITRFKNSVQKPEVTVGAISQMIRHRVPVHLGGMSDPFQPVEIKEQISYKILRHLTAEQYPIVISTKSPLVSTTKYLSILKESKGVVVQFSFSSTRDSVAKITEPHSNSPSEILKAMEILSSQGIIVTARWQPYIPHVSEPPEEFLSRVINVGIKHIGFEHLKLPVETSNPLWRRLSAAVNFDILKFYKEHGAVSDGREFILPSKFKLVAALRVKELAGSFGVTFGAADNDLQYLSDNSCCCSGVDQFPGFENWNKFQIAHAIRKSIGQEIRIDSILNEWRPTGAIDKYVNSRSRIHTDGSSPQVEDYIFDRWENLKSAFNPIRFYGVIDSEKRDSNGFRIFKWDSINQ